MAVTYDPRGMDWDQWCALTAEQFAAQNIGTAPEEQWQAWVDGVVGIGYFMDSAVPDSRGFDDWRDWAQMMVGIMSLKA